MKHQVVPMDLVAVDTVDGRVFSFLSVTWGLLADIDIESERFRSLGGARFTVEAVARLISEYMTFQIKYEFMFIFDIRKLACFEISNFSVLLILTLNFKLLGCHI